MFHGSIHFLSCANTTLLDCVCVCAQSWSTLSDPMDWSPPDSSGCGISQARIQEWVAICFSKRFSDTGMEPRLLLLLHWQADSSPVSLLGSLLP